MDNIQLMEYEIYFTEIIEQQQEIIEVIKQGFQLIISLIGVIIGIIIIITFLRGVFRHVGNWYFYRIYYNRS